MKWEELLKCVANVCSKRFFCDMFALCVSMSFLCSKDMGGYPKWLIQYGKPHLKWMITGGTPISGRHHMSSKCVAFRSDNVCD